LTGVSTGGWGAAARAIGPAEASISNDSHGPRSHAGIE
jgi:hypothetical protein